MKIIILTEQPKLKGYVKTETSHLRTDTAFALMIDAFFLPYHLLRTDEGREILKTADLVLFVPSKRLPELLGLAEEIKNEYHVKVGLIQEGDHTLWHDWIVANQFTFLSIVTKTIDIFFVHNESDKEYFKSITNKPVIVLKSTIFLNNLRDKRIHYKNKSDDVFVGGNLCRWYGGMNSYLAIKDLQFNKITFPSMGRKQVDEEELMTGIDKRIKYLPYLSWVEFMRELNHHKYAIHLMPEAAAGSFSLNCAALGIPCIGNIKDDTQRECFPDLSINIHDGDVIAKAQILMSLLQTNPDFYDMVVNKALERVELFDGMNRKEQILKEIENIIMVK